MLTRTRTQRGLRDSAGLDQLTGQRDRSQDLGASCPVLSTGTILPVGIEISFPKLFSQCFPSRRRGKEIRHPFDLAGTWPFVEEQLSITSPA